MGRFTYWYCKQNDSKWDEIHKFDKNNFNITDSTLSKVFGGWYNVSAMKVWKWYQCGQAPPPDEFTETAMAYGRKYEPIARRMFFESNPYLKGVTPGAIGHYKYGDWLYCSPDDLCIDLNNDDLIINIEYKARFMGEIPTDKTLIPWKHLLQVHAQMACSPAISFTYLVYIKGDQMKWFKIERNLKLEATIVNKAVEFKYHVLNGIEPKRGQFKLNPLDF